MVLVELPGSGAPPPFTPNKTIKLPSGREAAIRLVKVKDLITASKIVGANATAAGLTAALAAEVTQIDGKGFVYEDAIEMPLYDFVALQKAIDAQTPTTPAST